MDFAIEIHCNNKHKMSVEFVRIETEDLHGISRGLLVPKQYYVQDSDKGISMCKSGFILTPSGRILPNTGLSEEINFADAYFYPDGDTYKQLPWKSDTATVLGHVSLKPNDPNSEILAINSRALCEKAISKLDEMGLAMYGAYEYEFYLFKLNSCTELSSQGIGYCVTSFQIDKEEFAKDVMRNMQKMDIEPEVFHAELAPSQFEITYKPKFGIEIADTAFRFKQIIKEISLKHNMYASFMAKPVQEEIGSSAHFNHSLWKGDVNLFHDNSDEKKLSDIAKHWLAGLRYHVKALVALSISTNNCMDRLTSGFSKVTYNSWGIDDRGACYRVKNLDHNRTYIENRSPGASVNPYLLQTGVILAGVDGIEKKMKLVDENDSKFGDITLPTTFQEAADALNGDELFSKFFGKTFLKAYNAMKAYEIGSVANRSKEEIWEFYMKEYFRYL